jgi:phosphoribosylformylglycinamidine synthase
MAAFVHAGRPVIGICNGFQALVKAGILPGGPGSVSPSTGAAGKHAGATLTFNASGRFECRWVELRPVSGACAWTHGLATTISCPVAHGEGNFQVADDFALTEFVSHSQIALIYLDERGEAANGRYPANPNGSLLDIAGICNPAGNVLGLMPHPENHIHDYQHPRFARGESAGCGLALFENGVAYARQM